MGFFSNGPCRAGDTRWAERWAEEGVESGDLLYPHTPVRFIFGGLDAGPGPRHGVRYYLALRESGSSHVTAWVVPCMGHGVQSWPAGLDTLRVALTEPVVPEPVATAPVSDCSVPTPDKTFTIPSVGPAEQP
jgi:pimeloyl-ACP methyl ester carboxylesterase